MLTSTSRLLFRSLSPGDEPFRLELFLTSREREFSALPDEIRNTLAMQQYAGYLSGLDSAYPDAHHLAFSRADSAEPNRAVGIVSIADLGDCLQVIDLAVQPAFRNAGTGRLALEAVMERCRVTGQAIRGSVTPYNPARRLYARLGLRELDVVHGHIRLEWRPERSIPEANLGPSVGNAGEDADLSSTHSLQPRLKNS